MTRTDVGRVSVAIGFVACACGLALPASAQQARTLSLADAIRMAEEVSEDVAVARAGVMRADGQRLQARSEFFPQVFGSLGYTRTLASEFSSLRDEGDGDDNGQPSEDCGSFVPNPALPLSARVDSLEAYVRCASNENPFAAFRDLPFGRTNQWTLGLTATQTVFSGGRVLAQTRAASAGLQSAEIALQSARAQLVLDIAQAYYDAALADRLLEIAQATLTQAETTLSQVQVARRVGQQPEFELLRAQVTRDTQAPLVIQRQSARDIAHLRLRQLLEIPLDVSLDLTTALEEAGDEGVLRLALDLLEIEPDTVVALRAPVRQAEQSLQVQEGQVSIARAQRLPSLSLSTNWGRVAYPEDGVPTAWNEFRTNWTVSASVTVPLFTGGRVSGDVMVARAGLEEARARLSQMRELAALDTRSATESLRAAEATWLASTGTVDQARRAYDIADIRFTEGLSTQLELADSRILLQQAQANRAQSARDLLVARLRVALLPLLPLGAGGAQGGDAPTMGGAPAVGAPTGVRPGDRVGPPAGQTGGVRTGAVAAQTGRR